MKKIIVRHNHIELPNYTLGECKKLEDTLSYWDNDKRIMIPIGYNYDDENKRLLIPRGFSIPFIERVTDRIVTMDYNHDPVEKMFCNLTVEPRNDIQRKSLAFLIGEGDYTYTRIRSQLSLNLPPGTGKTYVSIAALSFYRERAMVITHIEKIKGQWKKSICGFTDLEESDICELKGSSKMLKVMEEKNIKYKIFLVNRRTLISFAERYGWDKLHEFFKKTGIGVKIYDEAHLEFNAILNIDLHVNTKRTLYLTATLKRTDPGENKVFESVYNTVAKYGTEVLNEQRKHIQYVAAYYNSNPSYSTQASVKNYYGFDKNKYCKYLCKSSHFENALSVLLDQFIKNEGKILILVTLIEACDHLHEIISKWYPDKKVAISNSTKSDEEKDEADKCDIIISTPKSFGTGSDLAGLRFCIMTEPYTSEVTADQISGRLREYDPELYTMYVELIDRGFDYVVKMAKKRRKVFKKKCNKLLELEL